MVDELCRQHGISRATFSNWRKRFSGMGRAMVRDYRQIRQENAQFKKMLAEALLHKEALEAVLGKKP